MTNTILKMVAMIAMLLDHIARFFPEAPAELYWVGRIAAPIFLFCCVIGFIHTTNRKQYFIRIYILSVVVELMNTALGIDYMLRTNFIRTILATLICLWLIEKVKNRDTTAWKWLVVVIVWQFTMFIAFLGDWYGVYDFNFINNGTHLFLTFTGSWVTLEYGFIFVLLGIFMYLTYQNKKLLILSFSAITALYVLVFNTQFIVVLDNWLNINEIPLFVLESIMLFMNLIIDVHRTIISNDLLYGNPQWMMIFVLPFILTYNGQKGKGLKWLFYVFYPLHIAILYIISQYFV